MKLFCGRAWAVHQLCPTESWWWCWWQSKELLSSAAFVGYRDWNAASRALRLPFLTKKNTFSPRKMVTFHLADSLLLTKAASFRTFQGGKAGFQMAAVSVEHTFLYLTLPKIQDKKKRMLENRQQCNKNTQVCKDTSVCRWNAISPEDPRGASCTEIKGEG